MGGVNKLTMPMYGVTVLERVVQQVTASRAGEVLAVLGFESDELAAMLAGYPLQVVSNPDYEQGMSTTVKAGVRAARKESQGYMFCLADLPLVETAEYDVLIDVFLGTLQEDDKTIVVPVYQGRRGNPALISAYYRGEVMNLTGDSGGRPIVSGHAEHVVYHEMEFDHILCDIDTPEAYRNALERTL